MSRRDRSRLELRLDALERHYESVQTHIEELHDMVSKRTEKAKSADLPQSKLGEVIDVPVKKVAGRPKKVEVKRKPGRPKKS